MNVFDNTVAPHITPRALVKGDYVAWRNSSYITDYPPASYTLAYNLRREGASAGELVITGSEDSGEYLFELEGSATVNLEAGAWFYDLYVTQISSSRRSTLKSGMIYLLANKAEDPDDPRSLPRKMVAELEALYERRLLNGQIDQTSFDNGETSAARNTDYILRHLQYWQRQLQSAIRKERARRGLGHSGIIRGRA